MKAKPLTAGNGKGLKEGHDRIKDCLNPTTKPFKTQLLGCFDHDTKNAIIITEREVPHA